MKKRIMALALMACMTVGLFAGCGSKKDDAKNASDSGQTETADGDQVTIRFAWWGSQERADKTNEAVKLFMEKNPDIKVETSFFPFESYYENLTIAASAGNMPDVFQGFVGSNSDLMEANLVEPLDSYIEDGTINVDDISEGLLESAKIDGKTYGVALGCNVKCLIVDPEAYANAGIEVPEVAYDSWDALGEDLQKLKDSGLKYGGDDMFERGFTFPYFARQHGETIFSAEQESSINFSEQTYVDYYNYKLDWIKKGLIPPYDVTKESSGPEDSQIAKGNSAVRNCYSSQYTQIKDAAGKDLKLILMPGPDTDKGTDIRPGVHICMSSQSKQKEAAAKLIDFMTNDVDAYKILKADRGMPASAKVREAIYNDLTEDEQVVASVLELAEEHSSASDPIAKGDTKMIDDVNAGLMEDLEQQIVYGEITPKAAYQQINDQYGLK